MQNPSFFAKIPLERCGFYLMCLLCAAPLFFSHYPPMVDIPQHASQIVTLNHLLFNADYPYRDLFQINFTRPYWGGYFPVLLLDHFLPILLSMKILLGILLVITPWTVSRLRAHFSSDPALDWLALPVTFGFAFQWGFLNFLVGVPLALTFLLYAFRYAASPSLRTGLLLAVFSLVLLAVHLLAAAFAYGTAVLFILSNNTAWKSKLLAILPFFSGLPFAIIWLANKVAAGGISAQPGNWDLGIGRVPEFFSSSIGEPYNLSTLAIALLLFAAPFLSGFRLTRDRSRIIIFIALACWMMLGPNYIFGNYFTYNRFGIFIIPLFILLFEPSQKTLAGYQKLSRLIIFVIPVALVINHCLRFAIFDIESKGYKDISSQMQPGKRVVMLIFNNRSKSYDGPQLLHLPAWYQAEADGIVDFSFAQFPLQASYKASAVPLSRTGIEWSPEQFNWYLNQGWLYDYFVVKHRENMGPVLFRSTNCPVALVANSGEWWLFASDREQCHPLVRKN